MMADHYACIRCGKRIGPRGECECADLGKGAALPAATPTASVGLRLDAGKPRMDLLPPEAMIALAELYEVGSRKYAERNWEKGMPWGKCFACMMRHAWKWMAGEDHDDETGCHHMIHVAWNAIAIFVYARRGIGKDDRPGLGGRY